MEKELQMWEEVETEDAKIILVSYGISSRVCREAVKTARKKGWKVGMIRPITLWPFPKKAFAKTNSHAEAYLTVEMNACGQMVEDVALYGRGVPIYSYPSGRSIADPEAILQKIESIMNGEEKEVF